MRLRGKNALVTGGSNGIGRAIAISFAREGANVLFTYKSDPGAAEQTLREIEKHGVRADALEANVSESGSIDRICDRAIEFLGIVNVLVNNVGVLTRTPFVEITPDQFDYVLSTNLRAPFFLSQRIAKHMLEEKISGSMINISSLSSERAVSRVAHYQSSKAALSMFSKSIAYELAPFGIRVNTISPGLTASKGNRNQWESNPDVWKERMKMIPLGRAGVPEDHAGAAVFLASDESSWITGANIVIDGGHAVV